MDTVYKSIINFSIEKILYALKILESTDFQYAKNIVIFTLLLSIIFIFIKDCVCNNINISIFFKEYRLKIIFILFNSILSIILIDVVENTDIFLNLYNYYTCIENNLFQKNIFLLTILILMIMQIPTILDIITYPIINMAYTMSDTEKLKIQFKKIVVTIIEEILFFVVLSNLLKFKTSLSPLMFLIFIVVISEPPLLTLRLEEGASLQ